MKFQNIKPTVCFTETINIKKLCSERIYAHGQKY